MIRESAQNNIGHMKDIINENNKIVERHPRILIEPQKITGHGKYWDCTKGGFQNNLDESSNTIEKPIKVSGRVDFEDERHTEPIMELVWQVDEAVGLINEK